MAKTEFYESAVKAGFYGVDKQGLFGKKDNVRKYWEDTCIKLSLRPLVENMQEDSNPLRVIDLGSGSGEGFDLLTHIPVSKISPEKNFIFSGKDLAYTGVDLSPGMVSQGRKNYAARPNVRFEEANLAEGFPLLNEEPFDIYFSSYCSFSHLSVSELEDISVQIFKHGKPGSLMVFDLYGRLSPEWPAYWAQNTEGMLDYTMAYLLPETERSSEKIDWFKVKFWTAEELRALVGRAAERSGRKVSWQCLRDRSILVGRHMDNTLFKSKLFYPRLELNKLFDRDYRGNPANLKLDLSYLEPFRESSVEAFERINAYNRDWNIVLDLLASLHSGDDGRIKQLIESTAPELSEELKMLTWLYRNAQRFPVVDFWSSIMGPQVACVLRNLEFNLPAGLGCGHSLLGIVSIS
ncbi:MAG: hypothetical protein A2X49_01130 [Lentisphaerae bacterium GWF2_52_8]|nr:MAG: hypothetical protein A2X49_01130 [Lentisphaerae bacterium GWF2_52_8]